MLTSPQGDESDVIIDGAIRIPETSWQLIPGSNPAMVSASVVMREGYHVIAHERLVRFGAELYSIDSIGCAFAFPLGQCLDPIFDFTPPNNITTPAPTLTPGDRESKSQPLLP